MVGVAIAAFGIWIGRPIYLFVDLISIGPYTRAYNQRCQRLADEAELIGRPEKDVELILGPASFLYDRPPGSTDNTYNYAPVAWFPYRKFQVHCENGIVTGLEQFDD